jgi:predicted ester cyclase
MKNKEKNRVRVLSEKEKQRRRDMYNIRVAEHKKAAIMRIESETQFIENITLDELKEDLPKIAHEITLLIAKKKIVGKVDFEDYCIIALIKKVSNQVRVTFLEKKIMEITELKIKTVIGRLSKLRKMGIYKSEGKGLGNGSMNRYPIFQSDLFTF